MTELSPGAQLGPYRIEALLGAGGMGRVFKALDTRLNRTVAIKVCREEFSERFQREARAIAALNHPHICTLYDVGPDYLVMEYVEGKALKGPLPLNKVLQYGSQICEALEAAHRKGVIHRDLKPSNILVTRSGVKVLDFGLAKMAGDETLTQAGAVMGTPAYMAPEQWEGKEADARSDIYALGSVIYEMATGERVPHKALEPAALDRVVKTCVAEDVEERWQSAREVKLALELARPGGVSQPAELPAATRSRRSRTWPILAGFAVIALALLILQRFVFPVFPTPEPYLFSPFLTEAAEESYPSWSPDGKTIAYFADVDAVKQIFTKSLGSAIPAQITKSPTDCVNPFWSPDGARIYYSSLGGLFSIGASGGEPKLLMKGTQAAAISSKNMLAFVKGAGGNMSLWMASTPTATAEHYRKPPFPETFTRSWTIDFSHDSSKLAVLMEREGTDGFKTELWIVPLPSGPAERVFDSLPFTPTINPARNHRISWMPDNRRLVVDAPIPHRSGNHLNLIDTKRRTVSPITSGTGAEWTPSVSPDGQKIAFGSGQYDFDVIQVSLDGLESRTLLGTASREESPTWSPSGRQFAYVSYASGEAELMLRNLEDSWGIPVLNKATEGLPRWEHLARPMFSPDGKRIAFEAIGAKHAIWVSSPGGGRPVPLDMESYDNHGPAWSPDGNWIAYQRFHKGKWELVKVPLGGGQPVRLSDAAVGGGNVVWSPAGDWLCFVIRGSLRLVSADSKVQRLLVDSRLAAHGFSKDGSLVYLIRRGQNRAWELAAVDVNNAKERRIGELRFPKSAIVSGFSLHPDGKSFLTSVGTPKFDIWILDGLRKQRPFPDWALF